MTQTVTDPRPTEVIEAEAACRKANADYIEAEAAHEKALNACEEAMDAYCRAGAAYRKAEAAYIKVMLRSKPRMPNDKREVNDG